MLEKVSLYLMRSLYIMYTRIIEVHEIFKRAVNSASRGKGVGKTMHQYNQVTLHEVRLQQMHGVGVDFSGYRSI